jgi:phenylalanyl-tRNA synthetase beta chain
VWGKLHPAVAEEFELPDPAYVFEVVIGPLVELAQRVPEVRSLSEYPAAFRDLSFVLPDGIPYQTIDLIIRGCAGSLLDRAELFDRYQGKQIPEGHVSLTFRIAYRKADGTLTDAEVLKVHKDVCDGLRARCQAQIRES